MTFAYGQQFSWKSHEPTLAPPHQGLLWTRSLEKSHTSCILADSRKPNQNKYLFNLFLFISPFWNNIFSSSVTSSSGLMNAAPRLRGSLATSTNSASVILTQSPSISCSRCRVDSAEDLPTQVTCPGEIHLLDRKLNLTLTWHSDVTVGPQHPGEVNLIHKTCYNGPRAGFRIYRLQGIQHMLEDCKMISIVPHPSS